MPLLKSTSVKEATTPPRPPPNHEKPLPTTEVAQRPGTAGTEVFLMANTRRASDRFKQAQQAEKAYRAKKRSTVARANLDSAKAHYRDSYDHLRSALRLSLTVIRMSPFLLTERSEEHQLKSDEKKRRRAQERSKKLEEALERERRSGSEEDEGEGRDDDTVEGRATPAKTVKSVGKSR